MVRAMKRYAAAAVLWGIAVGAVAYRYGVLPFMWSSPWKHVLPGLAIGLVFAGRALTRDAENSRADGRDDVRPAIPLLVALGLAGAALAFGLSYLAFPTLNRLSLERRDLPGFSLALPSGDEIQNDKDYARGRLSLKNVGGVNGVAIVGWEPGIEPATETDLKLVGELMVKAIDKTATASMTKVAGSDGKPVDTVLFRGEAAMALSMLQCGTRHVVIATGGRDVAMDLHERVIKSFVCKPVEELEATAKMTFPLVIDLPGWYAIANDPDQIQITDGENALTLRTTDANVKLDIAALVEPMFKAAGVQGSITSRDGDRVNIVLSDGGDSMDGWVRLVSCPKSSAFILALGTSKDNLDFLYNRVSAARCLRSGEPAQQWPTPPATLQQ